MFSLVRHIRAGPTFLRSFYSTKWSSRIFPPKTNVLVTGLPWNTSHTVLRETFVSKFGPIMYDRVIPGGKHAYVVFENLEDAKKAVEGSEEIVIKGSKLTLSYAKKEHVPGHTGAAMSAEALKSDGS